MRETLLNTITCVTVVSLGLFATQTSAQDSTALKTQKDKESYAIGVDLARNLKRRGLQLETDALVRGMRDVFSSGKLLMTDEDLRKTLLALQVEERRKVFQGRGGLALIAEQNREKGAAFLAQNKTSEGVITLPSGLQYQVLKTGNGPKPTLTDTVECRFRGTFIDGQEFNSSDRAGQPGVFKMADVVPGWKEALQLMPSGSKWKLFIPTELAYGEKGVVDARGRIKIPPNATLIVEMELLGIK